MASTGNPNPNPNPNQQQQQQQQQGGLVGGGGGGGSGPFDMNRFFNPSSISSPNPNYPIPTLTLPNMGPLPVPGVSTYATPPSQSSSPSPSPSASYPPPAYSYPPQIQTQTHTQTPYYHHIPTHPHLPYPHPHPQDHPQRSLSFPTPPLHPSPPSNPNPNPIPSAPPHNPNPNPGARLMALLTTPPPPPSSFDDSPHHPTPSIPLHPILPLQPPISHPSPLRLPSTKLPRGRSLLGLHVSYDVDLRLHGEEQPQLEVTPITKYVSDPALILGHQIAVNKTYICYGLKLGAIRVLNINTALRSLLRGHTQRVTDMAFFAEDVHLLASASIDGRFYVWKISEGSDEEEKPQISGVVVLAIHVTGDEGSIHPRVCWHCHKQEILVIAIGKSVLRIDTTKVGRGVEFVAEEPLECPLDKLIDGIQLVGKHDGEVTDLSMCQWMTTRLVSASKDGTIKIWEDRKTSPLLVLRPHDGRPVDAAKFLAAPHQPGHIVLITAGPLNREVKLWASSGEEGWLLPSDSESWLCTQTLELKSSTEPRSDEAFFNQVVALSQAGLVLLANAKKNAIYAVHLEYGGNPAATRMDYLAEFTVTMPILSFTGTSDFLPHGEHLVQVYCVQTQAIQQYALDLSQCLPPPIDNLGLEKSESSVSHDATAESIMVSSGNKSYEAPFPAKPSSQISVPESLPPELKGPVSSSSDATTMQEITTTVMDSNPASLLSVSSNADIASASTPLPLSPPLSRKSSDIRGEQSVNDYSVDRQMDNVQVSSAALPSSNDDNRTIQRNASDVVNPPVMFKHPTHLITPSEIMATSSGDTPSTTGKVESEAKTQDVVSNDNRNVEVEVKVVGEDGGSTNADDECTTYERDTHVTRGGRNEKASFYSQASDLGADMSRECCALPPESCIMEEARNSIMEALAHPSSNSGEEEDDEPNNNNNNNGEEEVSAKASDFSGTAAAPQAPPAAAAVKGKKQKLKISQASPSSSSQSVSSSAELLQGSVTVTTEAASSQIQETLNQLLASQKEMQKQISTMVGGPVAKEGKRLEAALGRNMEKAIKANTDALWARIQEDNAKHEKLLRERIQQITGLMNNFINKDLLGMLERVIKKEMGTVGTNVSRTIVPAIEKAISDSFQRGVGDKAVAQLDKSITTKLETTVARQIQTQFQTSGKQALQDGLKSTLEASIIPAFEVACKAMFEQVDSAFQKGMAEHTTTAQHQLESTHSQLALALREALNSASSLAQNLSGELAEGQRKLIALAGANPNTANPLVTQSSNGPLAALHDKVEQQPIDPTKELSRLISEHKYEEAFIAALQRSDVFIVSWLCSQVDLQRLLSIMPLPLSQGVLLSLLQQLACDISKETSRKLAWMTDVATCIVPHDPMIVVHARPILDQVLQILNHQRGTTASEQSSIRVLTRLINSMLISCK